MAPAAALAVFNYSAQTFDGLRINGTLEAPDAVLAVQLLESMRLRILEIGPIAQRKTRPLRDDAFVLFNRQLAQMAGAGLPIEKGLRLLSAGIHGGAMARAAAEIAGELREGVPLVEAFEKRRGQFPPIYGRMIDAGIRSGNLAGVLLKLGRQLELQLRLRAELWRNVSHPLMTLAALLTVIAFIGMVIMPRFEALFADFRLPVPLVTQMVFAIGGLAPYAAMVVIGTITVGLLLRRILRRTGAERMITDRFLISLAFVGPVLRFNLIARWVDAVSIGVAAGLELPAAIALAADATASPSLRRESAELTDLLVTGRPISTAGGRILPATVPTAIEVSAGQRDLPDTLQTLSDLYNGQAELRLERIPAVLTPLLVILIAILVAVVIGGLLFPLILMIREFMPFV
jgi:type II secretory pathway component PulF